MHHQVVDKIANEWQERLLAYAPQLPSKATQHRWDEEIAAKYGMRVVGRGDNIEGRGVVYVEKE